MRAVKYILYCILLSVSQIYSSEWSSIGFDGKWITSIAVNPVDKNIIYACIKGEGMYSTHDAGLTWNMEYQTPNNINCITINRMVPQMLYAGYSDGLIIKMSDSSQCRQIFIEKNINVTAIAFDETPSKCILLGTGKGLYKSFDLGKTFVQAGLNTFAINSLALNNTTPKAVIYAATSTAGIFTSANYGVSWSPVNKGLTSLNVFSILCDIQRPLTLYVGTLEENVYKSTNQGESWTPLALATGGNQGYILAQAIERTTNNSVIFISSFLGNVYKMKENDDTPSQLGEPINTATYGTCLGVTNIIPSTIYFGTSKGLLKFDE